MIHFMLDDLGCPTGVFAMLFSEITVQIIYFDLLVSRAGSHTFQRQAAFLRLVRAQLPRDYRIDHGKLKRIIGATLGFKSMKTAYATIKGIEVMRALRKGQASAFYYGDPLGEMRLVSRVFEM